MWPPSPSQDPQRPQPQGGPGQPPADPWPSPYTPQGQPQSPGQPPLPGPPHQQGQPYGPQDQQPFPGRPYNPQGRPPFPGRPYGQGQPPFPGQPYGPQNQQPFPGGPYNPQGGQPGPGGPWYPPPSGPQKGKPIWPWIVGAAVVALVGMVIAVVVLPDRTPTTAITKPTGETTGGTTSEPSPSPTLDGRLVKAASGKSQITVPNNWRKLSLHEEADVQMGNTSLEQYLMVITESQVDFDLQVDGYAKLVVDKLAKSLDGARVSKALPLKINGAKALQYEIHGSADGVLIAYWMTLVEGPKDFHQVIGWTLESKGTQYRPRMRQIIDTFEDLGA